MNEHWTDSTMLVRLSISLPSATRADKQISNEVAERHGVAPNTGRYRKRLLYSETLNKLQSISNKARAANAHFTTPWLDDGLRLLSADLYFEHMGSMSSYKEKFNRLYPQFLDNWDKELEEAKRLLGDMFNPLDYPSRETMDKKFSFSVTYLPVPTENDWRVELADNETEKVKQRIAENLKEAEHKVMNDTWQRVYDAVSHMAERLSSPENRLHKSMLQKMQGLSELLPALNITNDPELEKMAVDLQLRLCSANIDDLRSNEETRDEVANEAQEILRKIEGVLA